MRNARSARTGSPARVPGQLCILINAEWAYTTKGLEAISRDIVTSVKYLGQTEAVGTHF